MPPNDLFITGQRIEVARSLDVLRIDIKYVENPLHISNTPLLHKYMKIWRKAGLGNWNDLRTSRMGSQSLEKFNH